MKLPVGQRFVEPKIFDPPERILVEFTREIDPRAIQRYAHPNGLLISRFFTFIIFQKSLLF